MIVCSTALMPKAAGMVRFVHLYLNVDVKDRSALDRHGASVESDLSTADTGTLVNQ
jgi:hypothetical protein